MQKKEANMGTKQKNHAVETFGWWMSALLAAGQPERRALEREYDIPSGARPQEDNWLRSREFVLLMISLHRQRSGF
jgi:hypothetical protein